MGKDLSQSYATAANLFSEADQRLQRSISQVAFEGPIEELTKTANCQVALYVHGLALLEVLKEELGAFRFQAAAGLSLGEFTAHAAAGTFDFGTGLKLVDARSRLMEEACLSTTGTMGAFVGGDEAAVREIARETDVERQRALELLDLLVGQVDRQALDVGFEVLDLAPADDREDVLRLLHHVRDGDGLDVALHPKLLGDMLECLAVPSRRVQHVPQVPLGQTDVGMLRT